ncbi:hypothetical protein HGRIS_005188 [Hohenbuehelia grisea]|uniref:Uncharacterized protein n=1 Tax=Hohenbuehelia grisea TaxID=104357 RepID=A0ABR3JE95_9AGAR
MDREGIPEVTNIYKAIHETVFLSRYQIDYSSANTTEDMQFTRLIKIVSVVLAASSVASAANCLCTAPSVTLPGSVAQAVITAAGAAVGTITVTLPGLPPITLPGTALASVLAGPVGGLSTLTVPRTPCQLQGGTCPAGVCTGGACGA